MQGSGQSLASARAGRVLITLILVAGIANINRAVANVALPDIGEGSRHHKRPLIWSRSAIRSAWRPWCSTSAPSGTVTGASFLLMLGRALSMPACAGWR